MLTIAAIVSAVCATSVTTGLFFLLRRFSSGRSPDPLSDETAAAVVRAQVAPIAERSAAELERVEKLLAPLAGKLREHESRREQEFTALREELTSKLGTVRAPLKNLTKGMADIAKRLVEVDKSLTSHASAMAKSGDELRKRVEALEETQAEEQSDISLDTLSQAVVDANQRLTALEDFATNLPDPDAAVEERNAISAHLAYLDARLEPLESRQMPDAERILNTVMDAVTIKLLELDERLAQLSSLTSELCSASDEDLAARTEVQQQLAQVKSDLYALPSRLAATPHEHDALAGQRLTELEQQIEELRSLQSSAAIAETESGSSAFDERQAAPKPAATSNSQLSAINQLTERLSVLEAEVWQSRGLEMSRSRNETAIIADGVSDRASAADKLLREPSVATSSAQLTSTVTLPEGIVAIMTAPSEQKDSEKKREQLEAG